MHPASRGPRTQRGRFSASFILPTIVAMIVLVAGTWIGIRNATDRIDAFYVENAELVDPSLVAVGAQSDPGGTVVDPSERRPFAVYAHRIREGRGTVIGWRFYSNGDITVDDDEVYKKFTLWVDGPLPDSGDIDFTDPDKALAIYGEGGSAWPQNGCAGHVTGGSVHVTKTEGGYKVHVAVSAGLAGFPRNGQPCDDGQAVNLDFVARPVAVGQLTPWLGQQGRKPYDETYRR